MGAGPTRHVAARHLGALSAPRSRSERPPAFAPALALHSGLRCCLIFRKYVYVYVLRQAKPGEEEAMK
jgi:hypothetical protein